MIEFVWMRNPATGGVQKFAKQAAPAWRDAGWQPCEAPEEPNLALTTLLEQRTAQQAEEPVEAPDVPPVEIEASTQKSTAKNRRPSGAETEE